jgi:hypothetical protein
MRKFCLLLLAGALLVPAAALAERGTAGDGSLVVSNANARITVSGHGLIFGHLDRGTITIVGDYKPDDNTALSTISGARLRYNGGNLVYSGSNVRFLFPSGRYSLVIDGVGIDISAVGTGKFSAVGKGYPDDGTVSVDGGASQSVDFSGTLAYGKGSTTTTVSGGKARNG